MDTRTRLCTALMFCMLVLILNVFAVVEGFYVQPEGKLAGVVLPGGCLVAVWHSP